MYMDMIIFDNIMDIAMTISWLDTCVSKLYKQK